MKVSDQKLTDLRASALAYAKAAIANLEQPATYQSDAEVAAMNLHDALRSAEVLRDALQPHSYFSNH